MDDSLSDDELMVNACEMFELTRDAGMVAWTKKYKELSLLHHPDKGGEKE
jgi:hypothetical protein